MTDQVNIFCVGGKRLGYGHVQRSLALATALERQGHSVVLHGLTPETTGLLPHSVKPSNRGRVDVFDAPVGIEGNLRRTRREGRLSVALDWFGEEEPDVAVAIYEHVRVRARRASHVGFEFCILREAIRRQTPIVPRQGVVISLGSGDILRQGPGIASELGQVGLDVTLIQGPLASDSESSGSFRIAKNPSNFSALIAGCSWAVTNGGGTMLEAMHLDTPVVAVPQSSAEHEFALSLMERGVILGLGREALRAFSQEELEGHYGRGPNLIDGKGADRVAAIVGRLTGG